jgi:alanyl-tRNA synthetase
MEYNKTAEGKFIPLSQKNVDTGMGLERLACVMQGADNLFEVDTIKSVIEAIEAVSGRKYGAEKKCKNLKRNLNGANLKEPCLLFLLLTFLFPSKKKSEKPRKVNERNK